MCWELYRWSDVEKEEADPEILKVVLAYIEKNGVGNDPQGFEY